MALQTMDSVLDRVARVKHTIEGQAAPGAVQVAVDGPCPTPGCDARVVTEVRAGSSTVTCSSCGTTFGI